MSQHLLGITEKKSGNFAEWYSQCLTKGELIDYYDISGCYILRENGYHVWKMIQQHLNQQFEEDQVKEVYFPLFVSRKNLEKEAAHIKDFAPEVAWITRNNLEEESAEESPDKAPDKSTKELNIKELNIAIRPTSETVMYPYFKKWIQSYRDLPLKYNQWANVVRWEFKRPTPLIRSREFLWQEGHTSHVSESEAKEQAHKMLQVYREMYQKVLCVATIPGRKTEKEKFAGSDFTLTLEAFIPETGRGVQAATSHMLGQNFSKMFEITFSDQDDQNQFVYQTSWGLTTRSIGLMSMIHGDDRGVIFPPAVAPYQIVLVPTGVGKKTTLEELEELEKTVTFFQKKLQKAGFRAHADLRRFYSPPWKYNYWEKRGIPLRIEIGPREVKECAVTLISRLGMVKVKHLMLAEGIEEVVTKALDEISSQLYQKSQDSLDQSMIQADDWDQFKTHLKQKKMVAVSFCGGVDCEEEIKRKLLDDRIEGVKSLCQPLKPKIIEVDHCINPDCQSSSVNDTFFGKSY